MHSVMTNGSEHKPSGGITSRQAKFWCVGDVEIVEERHGGRYEVKDWLNLNLDRLRRLHAVLGHILQDTTAELDHDPFFDKEGGKGGGA